MNTLTIVNLSNDQFAAVKELFADEPATGQMPSAPEPVQEPVTTILPPDQPVTNQTSPQLADGWWYRSEVATLLRYLEFDKGEKQAKAIRIATADSAKRVTRDEILTIQGRTEGGLQGFTKPVNRVLKHLVRRGVLEARERDPLLVPEYVDGTATGYRIMTQVIDDPVSGDGDPEGIN